MDKKIIFEEILRIHQLMDVDVLLNETFNKDNLVLEQGGLMSRLVSLSTKFSDLTDKARMMKNSTMINPSTGEIMSYLPQVEELLKLEGKPKKFVKKLKEFGDEAADTTRRNIADEIINNFINKVHQENAELRDLQNKLDKLKSKLSNDEIQLQIDEVFYGKNGEEPLVKFNDESLRDLYVYNLRKKSNLDTEWKRPATVKPKDTKTPQQIMADLERAKRYNIESRFEEYQTIGYYLEYHSKSMGDNPPFKMPNIFKSRNLKRELQDSIKNAVDKQFGGALQADAAKLEDWVKKLDELNRTQKEQAIKLAANRVNKQLNNWFVRLLNYFRKKGIETIQIKKRLKEIPSNVMEFLGLIGKKDFEGATKFILKKIYSYILMFIITLINESFEYSIRKHYDKDTALPLFYVGLPPVEGGPEDWIGYIGKIYSSPILWIYDAFAMLVNAVTPALIYHDDGENYKEKLEGEITDLKDEGILPPSRLKNTDENTWKLFFDKIVPKDIKYSVTGTTGVNFLTDLSDSGGMDLVNWDTLLGLPTKQFYFNGNDIYFVNQNGRFEVKGLDTDDPYIKGKYDNEGKVEEVSIKKMFFDEDGDTINRFLVDFYPIDEQTKLLEKSSNYPKIIKPDDKWGSMQNKLKNAMGLVDVASPKKLQLASSEIKNLDMDNIISYDFYDETKYEIDVDPTKPGYYKPQDDNAKKIVSRLYYVDRTGNKDKDGNYPVYRIENSGIKPGDGIKPNTWYILKNNKIWVPLENFLNNTNTQTTTNESPEQRWLSENSNGSFKKLNPNKPTTWLYYTEPNNQGDRYIYKKNKFIPK